MTTLAPTPATENSLQKAALTIAKHNGPDNWWQWSPTIKIVLDHTWDYVKGNKVSIPDANNFNHTSWVIKDHSTCHQIWLALSDHIQDTEILYAACL